MAACRDVPDGREGRRCGWSCVTATAFCARLSRRCSGHAVIRSWPSRPRLAIASRPWLRTARMPACSTCASRMAAASTRPGRYNNEFRRQRSCYFPASSILRRWRKRRRSESRDSSARTRSQKRSRVPSG